MFDRAEIWESWWNDLMTGEATSRENCAPRFTLNVPRMHGKPRWERPPKPNIDIPSP
jgi:hypothetical protein